jgi:hypothetical protein
MNLSRDLIREIVTADTFRVSAEPLLLFAELTDSLALCLHDEAHGVGGLLHLRSVGGSGRPSDATDIEFSSLLGVLDRFKTGVMGQSGPSDAIQARILAHESPTASLDESDASLVDLLQADLIDAGIACGSQTLRRAEPVYVCFQPGEGRVRLCAATELPAMLPPRLQGGARTR